MTAQENTFDMSSIHCRAVALFIVFIAFVPWYMKPAIYAKPGILLPYRDMSCTL